MERRDNSSFTKWAWLLLRRQQELLELKIKPEISKHEYEEPFLSPRSQYATSLRALHKNQPL